MSHIQTLSWLKSKFAYNINWTREFTMFSVRIWCQILGECANLGFDACATPICANCVTMGIWLNHKRKILDSVTSKPRAKNKNGHTWRGTNIRQVIQIKWWIHETYNQQNGTHKCRCFKSFSLGITKMTKPSQVLTCYCPKTLQFVNTPPIAQCHVFVFLTGSQI